MSQQQKAGETKDNLGYRINLLKQLRDGTIKLSDKKFVVGDDFFILKEQPCDFAKIIIFSRKGDSIKYITSGANAYIFHYCTREVAIWIM